MQGRSPRSTRQAACFAVCLATAVLVAAGPAAAGRGGRGGLSISIVGIGSAAIQAEAKAEASKRAVLSSSSPSYYVGPRESIFIKLSGPLPPRARLYPLVRREDAGTWVVQQAAVGPGRGSAAREWIAEARFGAAADLGERFELLVIAVAEPLPPGPLPDRLRVESTLAESPAVHLERRRGRPSVAISGVDGVGVYGNGELKVHQTSTIEVVAHDLPAESRVGLVVQPAGTNQRWVMPELAGEGMVEITAYFGNGEPNLDAFRYTILAFVARKDTIPPRNRGLSPGEWGEYQARFLVQSRIVEAVLWESELRITAIGGLDVQAGRILTAGRQEDIHGVVGRQLAAGERIWLVCIPLQGDPWVAGWTSRLRPSGQWAVNAAALWQEGKPARFDVVAVLSSDDATRLQPHALRQWVHDEKRPHHSTRVAIASSGEGAAPATPRH